ncbi:MAG: hypothetical protein IT487_08570, partial [Chromatiaceae bacterium]|nr:hypothetical protein [Chromatiaceae bacterium]
MSDELSLRHSRQRLAGGDFDPLTAETAHRDAALGEAAWDIGDALPPAPPPPSDTPAEAAPPPAFAGFPGLGDEEEAPVKAKRGGLDLMRFLRGIWNRKWLVAGIALVIS